MASISVGRLGDNGYNNNKPTLTQKTGDNGYNNEPTLTQKTLKKIGDALLNGAVSAAEEAAKEGGKKLAGEAMEFVGSIFTK